MKRLSSILYAALIVAFVDPAAIAFDPLFNARIDYPAGDGPYSVFSADLDGDGDFDLAAANGALDNILILFNLSGPYPYVCGDADGSGAINILDVTRVINYLYKGGAAPDPIESGDADGSGSINILDVTRLINYLYKGGPEPVCPQKKYVSEQK